MIVLIRCNNILSDPRAMKYVKYLRESGKKYMLIGWDREGNTPDQPNTYYFRDKAGFNVGGFKAVSNRVKWMWYVYKTLKSINKKCLTLHCCDLDAAYPAAIYKQLIDKESLLIFDVFDWFSDTLYNQNAIIVAAMKYMEKISVRQSDYIIICEPERKEQIPYVIPSEKLKVLPNIPYFQDSAFLHKDKNYEFHNDLITFSYVGGFSEDRCLDTIIHIAKDGYINLAIAGFGNERIEKNLNNLKGHPNIRYYGKVKYQDGLQIMYNSDIVYAMYSIANPNNVYAAPNKYYEALLLGKPLVTTKGTLVEKKVQKSDIGYTIGEDVEELRVLICSLDRKDMDIKGGKAHDLWESKFKNYLADFFNHVYTNIIK